MLPSPASEKKMIGRILLFGILVQQNQRHSNYYKDNKPEMRVEMLSGKLQFIE